MIVFRNTNYQSKLTHYGGKLCKVAYNSIIDLLLKRPKFMFSLNADNNNTFDSSRYYKFEDEDGTIMVDIQKAREAMKKAMEMRAKRRKQTQSVSED
jgi:hypothetical protein